uniref:Teneurin-1-like n=1 Tax=Castor canadensis TaxID=51338 RepID=A0A8B7TQZ6_CASCN
MHSVARHGYQLEMGSDADTETEGAASPDHALRMWIRGMKSEHSSCLSSRANSALSLTDTDHERKSDGENGFKFSPVCCDMEAPAGSTQERESGEVKEDEVLESALVANGNESLNASVPCIPVASQEEKKIKYKTSRKLNNNTKHTHTKEDRHLSERSYKHQME